MTKKPLQNLTETRLTGMEQKILEAKLNPDYRLLNITEFCKLVGCSRPTYYKAFKNPVFMEKYKDDSKELIRQSTGPIINAFIKEAVRGSFNHGKILLEMMGLYEEKTQVDANVRGEMKDTHEYNIRYEEIAKDPELTELYKQLYRRKRNLETNSER
jgi:hypothetical protein